MADPVASIAEIPELLALEARTRLMRIPQEIDVPLTPRVQQIIDTAPFRRLSRISQLGLVSLVYPAAHHTRFEHSLGVYRMALLYLQRMQHCPAFCQTVTPADAEIFLLAALLHDLGHWPFCHPIEDLGLSQVPRHEEFASRFLREGEIRDAIHAGWKCAPEQIVDLLAKKTTVKSTRILQSMLSGPIDIDKMDYLMRDSLHAGVPYGRNFDQQRLIGSLCLNASGDGIAITDKGKTAAEMMVFSRYVMFSEVYWHHAVRSATAMLQRAFYLLIDQLDMDQLFCLPEGPFIQALRDQAASGPAARLLDGLFGQRRRLYKRWWQSNFLHHPDDYSRLARQPYPWLIACSEQIAKELGHRTGRPVSPEQIMIDAPPAKREVEFQVEVYQSKQQCYRHLHEVSPVVKTLAHRQFDDYVKSVRVFVAPELLDSMEGLEATEVIQTAIEKTR